VHDLKGVLFVLQEKLAFLHGMYQRLLAGRVMVPPKDTSIHQFTWADLTSLVYEQMCNLVTTAQRTDEKVSLLQKSSFMLYHLLMCVDEK
jgi:hypothetical protein